MDKLFEKSLNSDDWYFIHYASNGFYNEAFPAPKISCIQVYNYKTQEKYFFGISDYLAENSLEDAEKLMLENFSTFLRKRANICFIHWNMQSNGFGFNAVQARAKELGINLPVLNNKRLFDLASYVEYLAGKKLSMKQVLWFNSLLDNEFLEGKTEAEYFEQRKFAEIFNSVHSKITGMAFIAEEVKNETLKTEKPFAEANDGLSKEERRLQSQKIAAAREQMLKDIVNHNKNILKMKESSFEKFIESNEPKYEEEHGLFFFDFGHPLLSILCNWFVNR